MIKLMLLLALLGAILLHDSLAITSDQYSDKQSLALLQQITKAYPNFIDLPYEDVVRYLALTRAELGITEVPPAKTETKSIQKQTEEDEQDKQDEMEAGEKAAGASYKHCNKCVYIFFGHRSNPVHLYTPQ